jgi:hypothetical protein
MALLDSIRNLGRRASENLEKNIGGLLGEDVSKMSEEERRAIRQQAMAAIFNAMAQGTTPQAGLRQVAADVAARREAANVQRRQAAAEAALPDISSRIFGGRTGTMIEDVEGGPATPLMARRAPTAAGAREAIGMMYGTQAGRDVATMAPGLMTAAQEQMKPGEFVYQNVPNVGLVAVSKTNPSDVRVVQRVGREPAAQAKPELRAVRLSNGMVQDMWIAPGQSSGTPVGAPYAPKGAEGEALNERQRSGMNISRDAAIQYASNATGIPKEELDKKSPAEIENLMKTRGGRFLQGGTARTLAGLPVVGDFARTIIDAANADLIGPSTQGGAGIAMVQNPTGPITGPDVDIGIRQFPNPLLPVEVQAQMIRSILERDGRVEQYDANGNKVR